MPAARPGDPMGGPPVYLRSIDEADVARNEPAPDNLSRLHKAPGGAFNGVWSAWVKKAAFSQGGTYIKSNPRLNSAHQRS
eukprot:8434566-Pyramimonas_sp.AAC.1